MLSFFRTNKFQIIKFILTGVLSSFLNFIFYSSIYILTNNLLLSSFIGYLVGLLNSFCFSKIWVFSNSERSNFRNQLFLFSLIYLLGGIEMSLIIVLVDGITDNYKIAWLSGAFIAASNNYLGSKYYLFRK